MLNALTDSLKQGAEYILLQRHGEVVVSPTGQIR